MSDGGYGSSQPIGRSPAGLGQLPEGADGCAEPSPRSVGTDQECKELGQLLWGEDEPYSLVLGKNRSRTSPGAPGPGKKRAYRRGPDVPGGREGGGGLLSSADGTGEAPK